jgi:hypothetical protein
LDIRTTIEIAAHSGQVWEVLVDFTDYPRWNPFIREIKGETRVGARLEVSIAQANGSAMRFRPMVLAASREREFRWKGRLLFPGLFDGEHYFLLEEHGDGCLLTHGERFSGILPRLMGRRLLDNVRSGFEAMNAALKREAEARLRA